MPRPPPERTGGGTAGGAAAPGGGAAALTLLERAALRKGPCRQQQAKDQDASAGPHGGALRRVFGGAACGVLLNRHRWVADGVRKLVNGGAAAIARRGLRRNAGSVACWALMMCPRPRGPRLTAGSTQRGPPPCHRCGGMIAIQRHLDPGRQGWLAAAAPCTGSGNLCAPTGNSAASGRLGGWVFCTCLEACNSHRAVSEAPGSCVHRRTLEYQSGAALPGSSTRLGACPCSPRPCLPPPHYSCRGWLQGAAPMQVRRRRRRSEAWPTARRHHQSTSQAKGPGSMPARDRRL